MYILILKIHNYNRRKSQLNLNYYQFFQKKHYYKLCANNNDSWNYYITEVLNQMKRFNNFIFKKIPFYYCFKFRLFFEIIS